MGLSCHHFGRPCAIEDVYDKFVNQICCFESASPVLDPRIVGSFAASTSVEDDVVVDRAMSFKSGVPSSSDILLVASELGKSWKMLGRILCLPNPVLEQIEEDEHHLPERCYGVYRINNNKMG